MPENREALPRRSDAPWSDEQIAAIDAHQSNPRAHPLTCPDHSNIPLLVFRGALRCDVPTCSYTQTWVPGGCAEVSGRV